MFEPNQDSSCPVGAALNVIGAKWKIMILFCLLKGTQRFSELQRKLPGITQKMLAMRLRELEKDRVVHRHVYPVVPPKVEYSLTEFGETLRPVIKSVCDWGVHYLQEEDRER